MFCSLVLILIQWFVDSQGLLTLHKLLEKCEKRMEEGIMFRFDKKKIEMQLQMIMMKKIHKIIQIKEI